MPQSSTTDSHDQSLAQYESRDDLLEPEEAVATLQEGVGDGYGDRIAPRADLNRVAHDVFDNRSFTRIKDKRLEHSLWRYTHSWEIIENLIPDLGERVSTQPRTDEPELTDQEIIQLLQHAGTRKAEDEWPYTEEPDPLPDGD